MSLFRSKIFLILSGIIVLAIILRLFVLTTMPLYGDELTIVYDGYSILKTGYDQTGLSFPLTFPMGAGRPGGYIYASIPFIAIFGPTALGVRMLSFLSGIGILILIYFLGKKLFSTNIGLISSFLIAISMWDLSLSRGGFEAHFALLLALAAVYSLLKSTDKPFYLIISALSFGVAINTYPTFKLTLPLILLATFIYMGKRLIRHINEYKWYSIIAILIVIIFGFITLSQTFYSGSESRFSEINFLSQDKLRQEIIQKVNFERTADTVPSFFSPLLHNKLVEYSSVYLNAYVSNLAPEFLVIRGDGSPRHNMSGYGAFYYIEGILLFLGILALVKTTQIRKLSLLMSWILIVPLATAFLLTPHFLRNSFLLIPILLLVAVGINSVWSIKNRFQLIFRIIIIFGFLGQFVFFADRFYFLSPHIYGNFWSANAKAASLKAAEEKSNYDYVFLSNDIDNIEYAYPVYNLVDPKLVITQNQHLNKDSQILKNFDNVYIGEKTESQVEELFKNKKILYIDTDDSPENLGKLRYKSI